MEERQVTVDTVTHPLGTPFMVIATQNPIEHEGTYPLPEAQLDRFMMRLSIGYPSAEIEADDPGDPHRRDHRSREIGPVTRRARRGRDDRAGPRGPRRARDPPLHRRRWSRPRGGTRDIYLGASPRASIMILRAARAMAAAEERDYVIPDDVKALAMPALAHRIIVTADAVMSGRSPDVILREILADGAGPGGGEPLMLSGRGVAVLGAGLAMWVAARIVGSPGLEVVAIGLAVLPFVAAVVRVGAEQRLAVRRRLSDVRVAPGTRVTVHIDVENRSRGAHARSC